MKLVAWSLTDTGIKRDHNEDSFIADADLGLFAVADGMGGHLGGEHASRRALEVVRDAIERARPDLSAGVRTLRGELKRRWVGEDEEEEEDLDCTQERGRTRTEVELPAGGLEEEEVPPASTVLSIAARTASVEIFEESKRDPDLRGMGTTLTALFFDEGRMFLAHAGDSRAYLFRDGSIRQLTEDHSWIREQVKAGRMTEAEAQVSHLRHVITRSVGVERDVDLDVEGVAVEVGDCFLICSDGMSNYIDGDELEKLMSVTWYRRLPKVLVEIANERGGEDNITVVVVYAGNEESPEPEE